MYLDLFSEETPCGSILVSDHALSPRILGGRLREGSTVV